MIDLEQENRVLRQEIEYLKNEIAGKKNKLSDDAVDGIVATILIFAVVTAITLWLGNLPTS